MTGEYINGGLMLLILAAAVWILKSPKRPSGKSDKNPPKDTH